MSRISYLNGQYLPHENCMIHIEDRGFQFADAAYEVVLYKNGKLIDGKPHIERFFRSLREINIQHNFTAETLENIMLELFSRNKMPEGSCYMQITRGHHIRVPYCPKDLSPTIVATVAVGKKVSAEEFENGFSLLTHDDIRWARCDIKTVGLLASTLMNQKAKELGADDMLFVRDGFVTEASFANAFIVDQNQTIITRDADNFILRGITRDRFIKIAAEKGLKVVERKFTLAELFNASEVFLTSSSLILRPITKVDGKIIGNGKAGKISKILYQAYQDFLA